MELLISIAMLSVLYWLIGYWSRRAKKESTYPSATVRHLDDRVELDELDECDQRISE